MRLTFTLNNQSITLQADPARPLLDVLREDLGMTGTKQGCDHEGECGACTVLLDNIPVRSCLTPVAKVSGREVTTIEGLARNGVLHPLQKAFIHTGAVQCGYCTPGMLLSAKSLLDRDPDPTQEDIKEALAGNLCRCTGYRSIILAVHRAAAEMRGEVDPGPGPGRASPGVIGGSDIRSDSRDKVTGNTRYVGDLSLPDMLHLKVVRSPYHHALLQAINTEPAETVPGVVRILTARDIPGNNDLGDYSRDEPVLTPVGEPLRMNGAPFALVIARSAEAARRGALLVEADFQPLPYSFNLEDSLPENDYPIDPTRNILTSEEVRWGDFEESMQSSALTLKTEYHTSWQEHAALESEILLGFYDQDRRLTIMGGTHQPHWTRGYVASCLALDEDQVRVIMPPTGGSFGGKQDPWPFTALGLAVFHTGKPVQLAYSRRESFLVSPKRHPYRVTYLLGADREGRLTGIKVDVSANTGGYDGHGQYIANYALTASGGPYRYRAVIASARSVYTNGPKAGQFRGFGAPQSTFALECTLDEMAQQLEMDPIQFRRINTIQQDTTSFLGYPVAESLGYAAVMNAIEPHYREYLTRAGEFNQSSRRWKMGVGAAGMWYRFGKSGSLKTEARIELTPQGAFRVYCSAPDYGQGINTVMAQLAAETLGVPRERISIINADTALTPDSGIQGASRATYFVGSAVTRACRALKQSILSMAAEMLDCPPDVLVLQQGTVRCSSDQRSIPLAEIAREMDRVGKKRALSGVFDLSSRFPEEHRPEYIPLFVTGMQAAQVMVDLRTGEVRVLRMAAAHDVGKAINPIDARGQIEGAMIMGLGTALMEEYIPGESNSFRDYYLPTAMSLPDLHVELVEVPSFEGPFGAKGLGEAAILPTAPAIINAISRAVGTRIRRVPATPERVLEALKTGPGKIDD